MMMFSARLILILGTIFLNCVVGTSVDTINSGIRNKNVVRSIDVASQLVKISSSVTVENSGKNPVKSYVFATDGDIESSLSYIGAQVSDGPDNQVRVVKTQVQGQKDKSFWRVDLKEALQPGKTVNVEIETVFTHQLKPHPSQITQKEKQLVYYFGNHYFYSPYLTVKQSTTVNLNSRNVENYSKLKPASLSESTITYGPYENIGPFSEDKMTVHFENNAPFLTIIRMERVIEVSHWGNIAVEETVDLQHTGAVLKGPFSRYEYQRESQGGLNSVKSFKTVLPAAAMDVYYRDEIGNISTSHMKILSDAVELDLRPRFPLFGGWKTHYVIGYCVPSYEYLYNTGDDYVLKMRFLDHVLDDMVVDELTTRIILPEGSNSIKFSSPYPVQRLPDSVHFTYLDTTGRPVITLRKNNLVENHIQDFELEYHFPRILMLQEPFLVIAAFYLLFLLVIIYVRLDFSITKDEGKEIRKRVAGYCDEILNHQYKRAASYEHYEEQLNKLKSTKDLNSFQVSMKNINQEYKVETQKITDLITKLKPDAPDLAEKVMELQKFDRQLKDLFGNLQTLYGEKHLAKGRQQFLDNESQHLKRKEDLVEKINGIVKSINI